MFLSYGFAVSWKQPFRRVCLKQTRTPKKFKSVLTKSFKYNFITNIFSAKTRFIRLQINKKEGETNIPTDNISKRASVSFFILIAVKLSVIE